MIKRSLFVSVGALLALALTVPMTAGLDLAIASEDETSFEATTDGGAIAKV